MQNLLRVKKLVYRVTQSHLGGLELAFPLHFTLFRLVPQSVTGSAPVEQGGLHTARGSSLFLSPREAVKMAGFAPLRPF